MQTPIQLTIESQLREYLLRDGSIDPKQMPDLTDIEACWKSVPKPISPTVCPNTKTIRWHRWAG